MGLWVFRCTLTLALLVLGALGLGLPSSRYSSELLLNDEEVSAYINSQGFLCSQ